MQYDITNASSFEKLKPWVDELKAKGDSTTAIIIVGNKQDLESQRKVDKKMAMNFANR